MALQSGKKHRIFKSQYITSLHSKAIGKILQVHAIQFMEPGICMCEMRIIVWHNVSVNSNWVHLPPPWQPPGKFFWASESWLPGKFFCLLPLPQGKNDGQIPMGGAKFSQTQRNCSLNLQKILKKTMKQYKFFYLESLTKPLDVYFKLKQNHSKVLSPTLIFN